MANWLTNKGLLKQSRLALLNWFESNKRDLPWRRERDVFKVWISEIILQQTRVDQGLNYYQNFVKRFKNVEELAQASEDEILKLWEGLGYYSRARNMHIAAKQIALNGYPNNYKAWLQIKGVGPYTAAAISSIMYQEPVAAVDGNVDRVLSRLTNFKDPVNTTSGKKNINKWANVFLDPKQPGNFNEAVMELGARVCKPKNPDCENCVLSDFCLAKQNNTQGLIPVKEKKLKVKNRYLHFFVVQKEGDVIIEKRQANNIWKGLYQFPVIEFNEIPNGLEIKKHLFEKLNFKLEDFSKVKEVTHKLTHLNLFITFWFLDVELSSAVKAKKPLKWYAKAEVEQLSFPKPIQEFIREYL